VDNRLEEADALVIGPDHLDSFATNITAGLRSLGIATTVVDPSGGFARTGTLRVYTAYGAIVSEAVRRVDRVQRLLVDRPIERQLARSDPLLVISVWSQFNPRQIERWRKLTPRATWVFWYPDAIVNLGAHRMLLAPYDHFFFKEPHLVDLLSTRTRLPVHMLAQACNPDHHRSESPRSDEERRRYQCDVAIAGNIYPYRLLVMEALPDQIDLRIYGNPRVNLPAGFERFAPAWTREYVAGRTKALAFRGAKIVLNTMHYGEIRGVNTRLFEATACGGFVLSHRGPDIEQYFTPGEEFAVFDTRRELAEAIHHYLNADNERRAIAKAGQLRAHRDHTYPRRLRELLQIVGMGERFGSTSNS
jgi:spore maturation protein CgeB